MKDFNVKGQLEFRALLFVPRRSGTASWMIVMSSFWNGCILSGASWVRRITLCFTSRETLQQNKTLRVIMTNLAKKCLEMSAEIANTKDDFLASCVMLGKGLKFGIHEDSTDDSETVELLPDTSKSGGEQLSLKKSVYRVVEGQQDTFFHRWREHRRRFPFTRWHESISVAL